MDGTIYEIKSVRPRVKTKLIIFGEAKDTILNLIIGENVQTYIKIKASDLIQVLEEMKLIEKSDKESTHQEYSLVKFVEH